MRAIAVFLLIMFCTLLQAQEVVATAGSTLSNTNGSISFTIGESVTNTLINGNKTITQGFHQTNISVSQVSEVIDLDFNITAFPNPTDDLLTLSLDKEDVAGLQYLIFDTNGKLLIRKKLEGPETIISVKQFTSGLYILKVFSGQKELKSFKIIKQ